MRYLGLKNTELEAFLDGESLILDKKAAMRQHIMYMLDRTSQMFKYNGLPDTMPQCEIERMLQMKGYIIVARPGAKKANIQGADFDIDVKSEDKPFAFWAGLGGEPDPYYNPTMTIVANASPQTQFSKQYWLSKDAVLVKNDTHCLGMLPLHRFYSELMTEAIISLRSVLINARMHKTIIADNDRAQESARVYLQQLEAGQYGIIEDAAMIGNTRTDNGGAGPANAVIQVIEALQYLKSNWYNEVGLNSAFNMKREYISAEEVAANDDMLMPLVDDMLECRQIGFDRVNKLFGTNITVEKNSAWENKELEKDISLENEENANVRTEDGEHDG